MIIKAPDQTDIPALRALWQEAFGDTDAFLDDFFETAWSEDRSRGIFCDGEAAAALYWFDCSLLGRKIAYIYAVATAEKHRGKGLCRTLMEDTHTHLREAGYSGAVLVPAEGLFSLYGSMGYRVCGKVKEFTCRAGGESAALQSLSAPDYAAARSRYLPEGGVIQEGKTLAFLSSFAAFYAGKDFLLCGTAQQGTFFCQELLGNAQAAPEILTALGCEKGNFRTPGVETDFAMYLPFDRTPPPAYFGLALD